MLDSSMILDFKSKLHVMIPHIQEMQSEAYACHENIFAMLSSKALNSLYLMELDLDKSKPFNLDEFEQAKKEVQQLG